MDKARIEAKLADIEAGHAEVLNMSAEDVSNSEDTVYWSSRRARAIGMIDALNFVLGRETDNSRYPCMTNWRQAAANAGQKPWAKD